MSAPLRCAVLDATHRGAVLVVDVLLDIRVPGQPADSAPFRLALCESCLLDARRQFAALRQAFGGVSS